MGKRPRLLLRFKKNMALSDTTKKYKIKALITGRKRFQTQERNNILSIEQDNQGLFKINPWLFTKSEVKEQLEKVQLPELLLLKGYLSIGCEPCTTPYCGEGDPRSGSAAKENKKNVEFIYREVFMETHLKSRKKNISGGDEKKDKGEERQLELENLDHLDHLDRLESLSIYIFREMFRTMKKKPAMLWSFGERQYGHDLPCKESLFWSSPFSSHSLRY